MKPATIPRIWHAPHGMLSNVEYRSQGGTAVPRDYVEFPSRMKNWMTQPEVLAQFAKHYKTGEVIPQELGEENPSGQQVQPRLCHR